MLPVHTLYHIAGESGPLLNRVENAMQWLCSAEAEHTGEMLLRNAYALHGKPLKIELDQAIGYAPANHTLHIDPVAIEKIILPELGQPQSLEAALAHELTHAGQEGLAEAEQKRQRLEIQINESMLTEGFRAGPTLTALDECIRQAKDRPTALAYVEFLVDHFARPQWMQFEHLKQSHPDYRQYLQEFEIPAITTQNHIAQLQRRPLRELEYTVPWESARTALVEQHAARYFRGKHLLALPAPHETSHFQSLVQSQKPSRSAALPNEGLGR